MTAFNGLGIDLGNLSRLSTAKTRSISPENFTGDKGRGGMATEGTGSGSGRYIGQGWKISPSIDIAGGETRVLADIEGPGAIQHIWMTPTGAWRASILRVYWDDEPNPAIECPVGDFFACGWNEYYQVSSLAVCVNPRSGLNCYWKMPFRRRCRMTLTNTGEAEMTLYYRVTYALTEVPEDAAYFHAQFRRVNPLPYKTDYAVLDVVGQGHYVGTYMAWGSNTPGWWGEGEIKFFIDGDVDLPTICGTGTEDYFGGSYDFDLGKAGGGYREFTTPYTGLQMIQPDGLDRSQMRFGMYRWHITDPIRFEQDLRVTNQALGWGKRDQYVVLQDDIASVAYWYRDATGRAAPAASGPRLPRNPLTA